MSMFIRACIVLSCIGVIFGCVVSFRHEFGVVSVLRGTTNDQIDSFTAMSTGTGMSTGMSTGTDTGSGYRPETAVSARTVRDLLEACVRLTLYAPRLKAEPALAQTVRTRCADLAGQMLEGAPANARAWAVRVLMAPELIASDLGAAQQAAPYEPWPLNTRLEAIRRAGPLAADLQPLVQADFARALQSSWGRGQMATIYAQRTDLRALIQGALDGLPPADQTDFIQRTRRSQTRSG
jgi:hypothetical protein